MHAILSICAEVIEHKDDEAADVAIALLAFCAKVGIDLESEILKKHAINLTRNWTRNAAGQWERKK